MTRSVASTAARRSLPPPPSRLWRTPLLAGLCFGLGYGATNRLLALQWSGLVQLGQSFDVRPFPGTGLESLRQRFGTGPQRLGADLDQRERDAENRRAEAEARRQAEREQQLLEVPEQPLQSPPPADSTTEPPAEEPALTPPAAPAAPATPAAPAAPRAPSPSP